MRRFARSDSALAAHLAALALGVVASVLAYPPSAWPGLGLVMIAPIAWSLDALAPRRAFAFAWLYSTAFALWLCRWLVHALVVEYGVGAAAAWSFASLVIGALALVPATAGTAFAALRPAGIAAPLVFAALWTLGEWLRGALLGVPWLLAAQTQTRTPIAIQIADLTGQYGVSFVVLAIGAGAGLALRRGDVRLLALPAALAATTLGYGAWRFGQEFGSAAHARVGIVQASIPPAERFQADSAYRNVARHAEATRALVAEGALDLVVWSETAVDVDLDKSARVRSSLEALAREIATPLVTGAPRSANGPPTNAVVLFAGDGRLAESYDKQRLVPFSEFDPPGFGWLGALIGPVVEGEPYQPGAAPTVFRAGPIPLSTPICFEITDARLVGRFRAAGAALLVNLSNDAWFGPVGYPEMHLDHAVLRAVELRMPVVRGANTGISALVDAHGRVVASLPAFTEGTLRVEVAAAGDAPLYARTGDAPLVIALALMAAAGWRPGAARAARPRRSGSSRRAGARGRAR
jgi:apolipoprotein N-acyltransferase